MEYLFPVFMYLMIGFWIAMLILKSVKEHNERMEWWEVPTIILVWPIIVGYGVTCKLLKR